MEVTKLTGLSSEEGTYLRGVWGSTIDLRGMLLAGIVIGALGVLNDVTVTQASAVWEIYRANPSVNAGHLYRSAMQIGRDHIASTVDPGPGLRRRRPSPLCHLHRGRPAPG